LGYGLSSPAARAASTFLILLIDFAALSALVNGDSFEGMVSAFSLQDLTHACLISLE